MKRYLAFDLGASSGRALAGHISQDETLVVEEIHQFTANATGLTVVAGPYEGTAIGNLMVQAMADGTVSELGIQRNMVYSNQVDEVHLGDIH